MDDVRRHYDALIDAGNDPFWDPPELQAYMNGWDGDCFLNALHLNEDLDVLEIGIGTGRLAHRVAPFCLQLTGLDVSSKSLARAAENLKDHSNIVLAEGDLLTAKPGRSFDLIYSSLTFFHIEAKQEAIARCAELLRTGGRLVISIEKEQRTGVEFEDRKLVFYPDQSEAMATMMRHAGLVIESFQETSFAWIITAKKKAIVPESLSPSDAV